MNDVSLKVGRISGLKGAIDKIVDNRFTKIEKYSKKSIRKQALKFKGSAAGSFSDDGAVIGIRVLPQLEMRICPTELTREVFRVNAEKQSGGVLTYAEAPEWFEYHKIKAKSVHVRATGEPGGLRSPLGSPDRNIFGITFKDLKKNIKNIIK